VVHESSVRALAIARCYVVPQSRDGGFVPSDVPRNGITLHFPMSCFSCTFQVPRGYCCAHLAPFSPTLDVISRRVVVTWLKSPPRTSRERSIHPLLNPGTKYLNVQTELWIKASLAICIEMYSRSQRLIQSTFATTSHCLVFFLPLLYIHCHTSPSKQTIPPWAASLRTRARSQRFASLRCGARFINIGVHSFRERAAGGYPSLPPPLTLAFAVPQAHLQG
jgi:hypothetical protein